jgi:hypothetical protein
MHPPSNHTYSSIAKFQQFVELKDYRLPTKKEYARYVGKCAEHFGGDPFTLSEKGVPHLRIFPLGGVISYMAIVGIARPPRFSTRVMAFGLLRAEIVNAKHAELRECPLSCS